ncbi:type II toxin-antitoxin system RelE/ParE family toxin [Novosphingobium sp.]|uniref:type II toxin-antitoxin system RelE/ParE family toxin n=1 Tax=Novosphingobium sp. TaxID=1874826 RepID=UPI003BA9BB98
MRQVIWSREALSDAADMLRHIATDDANAAHQVIDRIEATGDALGKFATGHPGRVAGTYEKSVRTLPYIIAYALTADDETVVILRVIHAARDWREQDWPQDR